MSVVPVVSTAPKGIGFVRYLAAQIQAKGNTMHAAEIARQWRNTPWVADCITRSVVAPGTATNAGFAAPLVPTEAAQDFIEALRPADLLTRVTGFRPVGFNVATPRIVTGANASWHAEGAVVPLTKESFDSLPALPPRCIIADVPITSELARLSTPSAEKTIRFDLTSAVAFATAATFFDRANAGSSSRPKSIANAAPTVASTGNTAAQIAHDLGQAAALMAAAGCLFTAPYIAMSATLCALLAFRTTTSGALCFPDLTPRGGSIGGVPVIATGAIPVLTGDVSDIVLFDASLIELANDENISAMTATDATIEMSTTPTDPPTASTVLQSLWQTDCAVIRVLRYVNWQRTVDAAACVVVTDVPSA